LTKYNGEVLPIVGISVSLSDTFMPVDCGKQCDGVEALEEDRWELKTTRKRYSTSSRN
jgi:hypothetical protein